MSGYASHLAAWDAREAALGRKLPGRKPSASGKRGRERIADPTDPDSRMLRARNRFVQGYNAQAAVAEDQVIVTSKVTNEANDSTMLAPMVAATEENLERAGAASVQSVDADTGFWSVDNGTLTTSAELLVTPMPAREGELAPDDPRLDECPRVLAAMERGELSAAEAALEMGISENWARQLLHDRRRRRGDPAVLRKQMLDRLASPDGRRRNALRKGTTDPVFDNLKANLRCRRFSGRGIRAARDEWRYQGLSGARPLSWPRLSPASPRCPR